jgi:hypothetical protein
VETLLPEAMLCDRLVLFREHRRGFSQTVKEWAEQLNLTSVLFVSDAGKVRDAHQVAKEAVLDEAWTRFTEMSSTAYAASLFETRWAVYQVLREASTLSRLGVRASMLAISGSLALSYTGRRDCGKCGCRFTFEHFLQCPELGTPREHTLVAAVGNKDWPGAACVILSRFEVFMHLVKGGNFSADEAELFESLAKLSA